MFSTSTVSTVMGMENIKNLQWSLVLGLGALALARPLMNIVGLADQLGRPLTPVLVTLLISVVWIAAVGLSRVAQPVLTLTFAGLAYGVFAIVLSAVLSPILTGEFQGPLATPFAFAVVPVLITNAIWGAITGVIALLVQQMRGNRRTDDRSRSG